MFIVHVSYLVAHNTCTVNMYCVHADVVVSWTSPDKLRITAAARFIVAHANYLIGIGNRGLQGLEPP
jgi:hypothetical protein